MSSWHSYAKIYNLGHNYIKDLFEDSVVIEEKVDGSQFSFGVFDGVLKCRSKGQELITEAPEKMFALAVETAKKLVPILKDGHTYRGEYLQKPKHNALAYDRTPKDHIILFDISPSEESYLSYEDKKQEAARLGLEVVPLVFEGSVSSAAQVMDLMEKVSILGGQKIEGLVVKNYYKFGGDKKVLLGKYVSEAFKEVHKKDWKQSNPTQGDILKRLGEQYKSKARWNKSVQHLKERGLIENTPKDIGALFKEVVIDIEQECEFEIKEQLYKWAIPHIKRIVVQGLPDWYKEELVKLQFEETK